MTSRNRRGGADNSRKLGFEGKRQGYFEQLFFCFLWLFDIRLASKSRSKNRLAVPFGRGTLSSARA